MNKATHLLRKLTLFQATRFSRTDAHKQEE
ncbi:hypothetical protein F0521_29420 [Ferrimonas sp. YFM]|nr:hypothetical protein F0521_29420 [Ferrimonas sp. YFM]